MQFYFVECFIDGLMAHRSNLFTDKAYCYELAEEMMKQGYEYTSVESIWYEENEKDAPGGSRAPNS